MLSDPHNYCGFDHSRFFGKAFYYTESVIKRIFIHSLSIVKDLFFLFQGFTASSGLCQHFKKSPQCQSKVGSKAGAYKPKQPKPIVPMRGQTVQSLQHCVILVRFFKILSIKLYETYSKYLKSMYIRNKTGSQWQLFLDFFFYMLNFFYKSYKLHFVIIQLSFSL